LIKGKPVNLPASVRQRLLNVARQTKQGFGLLLTKYALERLLYRLSVSLYRDRFVLKGALLFDVWTDRPHRPTRDLDLLSHGDPSREGYQKIFHDLCTQPVEDDGLNFLGDSIAVERIRDDEEYEGVRILMQARLGTARISLQIDVGFGDVISPGPVEVTYPTLLDFPAPRLRAYPKETVVAEKFEAMVKLGMANTRMKDFYDVWELARRFEFDGLALAAAIRATFDRRATPLPVVTPLCMTAEFYDAPAKQIQWSAFFHKSALPSPGLLSDIVTLLRTFLLPILTSLQDNQTFKQTWLAGGPWKLS
jgi:predicted nucleotidyltransferase component of viral defense system